MFLYFFSDFAITSMTVSFDSTMARDVEELAAKSGMTAAEYVTKVVAEAIEDACDYERCAAIIDEYERNPVSFSHDEVMREFGLR